jgi:hypothetical protein
VLTYSLACFVLKEVVEWQWGAGFGWMASRARSLARIGLVKPVRNRLILMERAMLNQCVLQGCGQRVMTMNIKLFAASKPAHMVCTVH